MREGGWRKITTNDKRKNEPGLSPEGASLRVWGVSAVPAVRFYRQGDY